MRTLLERLKPEILERLNQEKEHFPQTVKIILRELKENTSADDLPIGRAHQLFLMSQPPGSFNLAEYYDFFTQ